MEHSVLSNDSKPVEISLHKSFTIKDDYPKNFKKDSTVYAIVFDLVVDKLKEHYTGNSYENAYADIKKELGVLGFKRQQGSVYFGNEKITSVSCVLAVQSLNRKFPWFKQCVKDIRMLRIEEDNDLQPVLL